MVQFIKTFVPNDVTEFGISIVVSPEFKKTESLKVVKEFGKLIPVRLEQLENVLLGSTVSWLDKVIPDKLVQS